MNADSHEEEEEEAGNAEEEKKAEKGERREGGGGGENAAGLLMFLLRCTCSARDTQARDACAQNEDIITRIVRAPLLASGRAGWRHPSSVPSSALLLGDGAWDGALEK